VLLLHQPNRGVAYVRQNMSESVFRYINRIKVERRWSVGGASVERRWSVGGASVERRWYVVTGVRES
jgi:hypothetical protein